jgi:putative transposase
MTRRGVENTEKLAHFVTFSCYRRRRLLDHDRARRIVLGVLQALLSRRRGRCVGFVLMPDHVHAVLWLPEAGGLAEFLKQWKRLSALEIKKFVGVHLKSYASQFDMREPVWQSRYYDFHLFTARKIAEKLAYMHQNPVCAGLVHHPCDWPWSSARYYERGRSVGVPVGWLD